MLKRKIFFGNADIIHNRIFRDKNQFIGSKLKAKVAKSIYENVLMVYVKIFVLLSANIFAKSK